MADRYMLLRPGESTIWDGNWVMDYYSDGYWQKGISKSYTKLSTGQYSGTTPITVASATDDHTNAVVLDNRTGLMWSAGKSSSVGPTGNGLLYWDDHCDVLELSSVPSTSFAYNDLITQANTGHTGFVRYQSGSEQTLAIVNPSNRPFSTAAADTITGSPSSGGSPSVSTYHTSSKEDIWSYCKAANESSLSSHSDWRVPNIFELITLLDFSSSKGGAWPSTDYFDRQTDFTWSATKKTANQQQVFAINMYNGAAYNSASVSLSFYPKTGVLRLVRGPSSTDTNYNNYPCRTLKTLATDPAVATYPDDGFYQIGQPRSYNTLEAGDYAGTSTWSAADGTELEISNNCIEDQNTGLMWTKGIVVGSTASTAAYCYYYDSYGQRLDALSIIRQINEQQVGGHNDWRIPNVFEAASILDASQSGDATTHFDYHTSAFFISTHRPDSTANVYRVTGGNLWGTGFAKISSHSTGGWAYVRAVRGGYTDADL